MDARLEATDACVIGGGVAGLVFARRARESERKVVVLDDSGDDDGVDDGKSVVIDSAAAAALEDLGALPADSRPIRRARIAFAGGGGGGVVGGEGEAALAYGVDHVAARRQLCEGVDLRRTRAIGVSPAPDGAIVEAVDGRRFSARLLVFACETGILPPPFRGRTYAHRQTVLSLTATARDWPSYAACQRFTGRGIAVLVPRADGDVGIILCASPTAAAGLSAMSDEALSAWLSGEFEADIRARGRRFAYAPRLSRTRPLAAGNIALAGGAATTLHPAGARGLALGIGDACLLAELFAGGAGEADLTASYIRRRAAAHFAAMLTTQTLALGAHLRAMPFRLAGGAAARLLNFPAASGIVRGAMRGRI